MIYRAELSERVLGQLGRFPAVTGRVDHDLLDKLTAQLKGATPWSVRPACDPGQDPAPG